MGWEPAGHMGSSARPRWSSVGAPPLPLNLSRFAALSDALESAVGALPSGPLVLLFSGGVDSALLALSLRERDSLQLLTVGSVGSTDLTVGRDTAAQLSIPWTGVTVLREDVYGMRDSLEGLLSEASPTEVAVQVSLGLAVRASPPGTIVCGQGADELFLGYAHFRKLPERAAGERAELDLATLLTRDWPLSREIAAGMQRTLVSPYLDPAFIDAARHVPLGLRLPGSTPKGYFRAWAVSRGLPESIALRPKKAFQYGSGVARFLRTGRRAA
jgi:asparagine synthase (glutamine-hydrolysing)